MMTNHGTHGRYSKGCRCDECRIAHRNYEREAKRRRTYIKYGFISPEPKFVDATETRQHIEFLRRNGIGLGTIAAKVGYHRSNIQRIARGQQARVARELEEKVLAIPSIAKSDHLYVSTAPLKKLLKKLEKKGITKADVARFMGYKNSYIQLKDFVRIYRFRKIEEACNYLLRSHRD